MLQVVQIPIAGRDLKTRRDDQRLLLRKRYRDNLRLVSSLLGLRDLDAMYVPQWNTGELVASAAAMEGNH